MSAHGYCIRKIGRGGIKAEALWRVPVSAAEMKKAVCAWINMEMVKLLFLICISNLGKQKLTIKI